MDYGCGMKRLALAAAAAAIGAIGADACTAILVGKKASATGRVIVAHNEDNRPGTFLYTASREEIEAETANLIAQGGKKGFILGSDCSIHDELPERKIRWVADAAHRI